MNRIEKLKKYLKGSPDDSFLKHALALEYIKNENDIEAKKLFDEILEKDSTYVGSYYHLGKLLERMNDNKNALKVYEKGMKEAVAKNDNHSYNELKAAHDDLIY